MAGVVDSVLEPSDEFEQSAHSEGDRSAKQENGRGKEEHDEQQEPRILEAASDSAKEMRSTLQIRSTGA